MYAQCVVHVQTSYDGVWRLLLIAGDIAVATYRQELYEVTVPAAGKIVEREDDAAPRLLCLAEEVAAGTMVTKCAMHSHADVDKGRTKAVGT
jgi:hypothetical protein